MKIQELIEKLEKIRDSCGNEECFVLAGDIMSICDATAVNQIRNTAKNTPFIDANICVIQCEKVYTYEMFLDQYWKGESNGN